MSGFQSLQMTHCDCFYQMALLVHGGAVDVVYLLRLFLMATWKSGLGNDIYYIHRSVKPVKWPVADGGEGKVAFLREFF